MPVTVHSNLSLFAIPTAYCLAFLPHMVKLGYLAANGIKFNNLNPRRPAVSAEEKDAHKITVSEVAGRLSATHTNGLESFPVFATAIVVGNFARLPAKTLNIVAGVFLASRVVFSAVYYLQRTEAQAWIRSGAFFSGIGASLYVLFSSASKVLKLTSY